MKNRSVPIKFLFTVRVKPLYELEAKLTKSKCYQYQQASTTVNETVEFPTTLEQNITTEVYQKKDLSFEVELRGVPAITGSVILSKEIDLAAFAEQKQWDLELRKGLFKASICLEVTCQIDANNESCRSSIIDHSKSIKSFAKLGLQNDVVIRQEEEAMEKEDSVNVKSMKSARKSRGWLTTAEQEEFTQLAKPQPQSKVVRESSPTQRSNKPYNAEVTMRISGSPTRRRQSKSQLDIQPITNKPSACKKSRDNKSLVDYELEKYRQKKIVRIEEENNVAHKSHEENGSDTDKSRSVYPKSLRSLEADSVVQHVELLEQNKRLKKQREEMRVKLSEFECKESQGLSLEKSVIERLKQELTASNQTIKELEQTISKLNYEIHDLQEKLRTCRSKISTLELEIQKRKMEQTINCPLKTKGDSPNWKEKYSELKRQSQLSLSQLNTKLQRLSNQKLLKEFVSPQDANEIPCMSRECDREKKQLKQSLKKTQKLVEDLEVKIRTKDKLLENYNNLQSERGRETLTKNEQDKLLAEKIVLETQLTQLRQQLALVQRSSTLAPSQIIRKSDKENMQKDLEKIRRSYYQLTQEREQEHRSLQEQIKNSKLQVMNVLNAVQEFGGRKLYDQISAALFQ